MEYIAREDASTLRKIGINVGVLVGITFVLIALAMILT